MRLSEAAAQGVPDGCRIGAAGRREQERFGDRADRYRDDHLVGELRDLAGARGPDMDGRPMARRTGSTRRNAPISPPAMIASVPASAPAVPPDTGASI